MPANGGLPTRGGRRLSMNWVGAVPFLLFVGIFLILPTLLVAIGAFFTDAGQFTLANVKELGQDYVLHAFQNSIVLSAETAVAGAVLGGILTYVVATGRPDGLLRRAVTAACGVLAQFGGVTLALAFIATIGSEGLLTVVLHDSFGRDVDPNLLYNLNGLALVYTYFQIPLMVLVFLPAVDGIKPQWREATESLGGSTWVYWRSVAMPILMPPFLGALLLLFANAFSAYATAYALTTGQVNLVPILIGFFLSGNVLDDPGLGYALAFWMILVIAVAIAVYQLMRRRTSRWLQ